MTRETATGRGPVGGDDGATNVLVSIEGAAGDRSVVRRAGTFVAGTGGRLTVLDVMPSGAFADRQCARQRVPGLPRFTLDAAAAERRRDAEHVTSEALDDVPVEYDCVGVVGREPDCIVAEARTRTCSHVFLTDQRRASLGAVDAKTVVRRVVEAFEGTVTVVRKDGSERERTGQTV